MKMDSLRLIGAQSVTLPILGADESGPFVLKSVEGLGPPEIVVRLSATVLEKAVYQGKSANLKQLIIIVGLQPDWNSGQTPEQLRTQLYSLLSPRYGQMLRAEVVSNGVVQGFAQGQISKFETAIFTKDPAVQLTMDCDYGYWLAPDAVVEEPAQRTLAGIRAFDVVNDGTAPSGFAMGVILRANPTGGDITLSDSDANGQKIVVKSAGFVAGDRFVVDTRPGSRGVWRGPAGGALVSVLNNLDASVSEWMQLYNGVNTLTLSTTAFDWDPAYLFQHQPAYWGV